MFKPDDVALIVTDVQPGQKFSHDGSIIFKTFVPDGVEVITKKGGILLEQGGGNNLVLSFSAAARKPTVSYVQSKGPLGNNVTITSDSPVLLQEVGEHLKVKGQGCFSAVNVGAYANIQRGGSIDVTGNVGAESYLESGVFVDINTIGEKSIVHGHESVEAQFVKQGTYLTSSNGHVSVETMEGTSTATARYSVSVKKRLG